MARARWGVGTGRRQGGGTMTSDERPDLLAMGYDELEGLLASWGEPRFRAAQVWQWLYRRAVETPEEMANLPAALRRRLAEEARITRLRVLDVRVADDGDTEKALFGAEDGETFEAVLMRYPERNTVCASSQIGCAVGCEFCATGRGGLVRDLSAGEIAAQVLHYVRTLAADDAHVTNVVFMGMGEPLLNDDAVWRAIRNLNDERGLGLGMRRFTISTSGVVPGIERLAREGSGVGLAISLHAPDDALRDQLVPINRRYPIDRLLEAADAYARATGRRPTYEYVLAEGINDADDQAWRLAERLRGLLCHVNLIPLNPTAGCPWRPPSTERVLRFQRILQDGHVPVTVRLSRGSEIRAACGQLRSRRAERGSEERP